MEIGKDNYKFGVASRIFSGIYHFREGDLLLLENTGSVSLVRDSENLPCGGENVPCGGGISGCKMTSIGF